MPRILWRLDNAKLMRSNDIKTKEQKEHNDNGWRLPLDDHLGTVLGDSVAPLWERHEAHLDFCPIVWGLGKSSVGMHEPVFSIFCLFPSDCEPICYLRNEARFAESN